MGASAPEKSKISEKEAAKMKKEMKIATEFGRIWVTGECKESKLVKESNSEDRTHLKNGVYATEILLHRHYEQKWDVAGVMLSVNKHEYLRKHGDAFEAVKYSADALQDLTNEQYEMIVNSNDKNSEYTKMIRKPEGA
jgi:hypothetical protein